MAWHMDKRKFYSLEIASGQIDKRAFFVWYISVLAERLREADGEKEREREQMKRIHPFAKKYEPDSGKGFGKSSIGWFYLYGCDLCLVKFRKQKHTILSSTLYFDILPFYVQ